MILRPEEVKYCSLSYPNVLGELVDRGRVAPLATPSGPAVENRLHGQREVGILLVILETIQIMSDWA